MPLAARECDGFSGIDVRMKDYSKPFFANVVESAAAGRFAHPDPRGGQDMMIPRHLATEHRCIRASKRSRMIRIVISEEALQDYARGSDGARLAAMSGFPAAADAN